MADLNCGVKSCVYNEECLCSKGDIMVGGKNAENSSDTCCESFLQKKEGRESMKSSIAHPSKFISIDCEATKCMYNSNYKCTADHVDIKGHDAKNDADTICATFREN